MASFDLDWFQQLSDQLKQSRHRACIVLKGNSEWRQQWLENLLATDHKTGMMIAADDMDVSHHPQLMVVPSQKLPHYLGQEIDFALFTSESGIDANALAQVAGMIRAGGILWLSLDKDWHLSPNPACEKYLSYPFTLNDSQTCFNAFLEDGFNQTAMLIEQGLNLPRLKPSEPNQADTHQSAFHATEDQKKVIGKVHSVAFGHRKRPLLVVADRGRGKSASLGMAALEMLKQGKQQIIVCASRLDQVQIAFNSALQMAQNEGVQILENKAGLGVFQFQNHCGHLQFKAPDELLQNDHECDLLMIDEAAHLPMPMLMDLVRRYHRLVMATTEQGYEGSGRSFKLRFKQFLDQQTPDWKQIKLAKPIRWNPQDPLEDALNHTLLFNQPTLAIHEVDQIQIEPIKPRQLIQDRSQLNQVFQLLVTAHYQTTPNDLMQLLETPNPQLWIAKDADSNQILGVLFALEEGQLPEQTEANRRFQGHLFPQLMWTQTHYQNWLADKTCRIVRIAVWPEWQRQQIGSRLLRTFIDYCEKNGFDSVSTSFGANPGLIDFWQQNQFIPLHLGIKRDKASGAHSLAAIRVISESSSQLADSSFKDFQQQLVNNLPQHFQHLDTELLISLLNAAQFHATEFPTGYLFNQPYEAVSYKLQQWTLGHTKLIQQLPEDIQKLWLQKVILHLDWPQLVKQSQYQSRKEIEVVFRSSFSNILNLRE